MRDNSCTKHDCKAEIVPTHNTLLYFLISFTSLELEAPCARLRRARERRLYGAAFTAPAEAVVVVDWPAAARRTPVDESSTAFCGCACGGCSILPSTAPS